MSATAPQQESPDQSQAESDEDRVLREQIEERRRKRDVKGEEDAQRPPRSGPEVIAAVANDEKNVREDEVGDALDWFLADDAADYTYELELNVGPPRRPYWVTWVIKPVDLDTLRRIRKEATGGNRAQRRARDTGEIDEVEANLGIVIAGTVSPDLKVAAQQEQRPPDELLRIKFARKPGLLGQIAGEIMGISGYDDEDVREVDAGKG